MSEVIHKIGFDWKIKFDWIKLVEYLILAVLLVAVIAGFYIYFTHVWEGFSQLPHGYGNIQLGTFIGI